MGGKEGENGLGFLGGKTKEGAHGGVGLGLPLVRRVAALHGGTLMLENEERGGTTAVLSIPIRNSGEVLKSPLVDRTGGFSQTLVELSELLPAQYFGPNDVN